MGAYESPWQGQTGKEINTSVEGKNKVDKGEQWHNKMSRAFPPSKQGDASTEYKSSKWSNKRGL